MANEREIRRVDLRTLRPLELNARFMAPEDEKKLVANIAKDGHLDSVPLAGRRIDDPDDDWWIVSGNHRVASAITAGVYEAEVMFILEPMDPKEFIAKQLSHNSIEGQDDPVILAELYTAIDDIDWKHYAGLDDDTLGLLEKVSVPALAEPPLNYRTVTLAFLPDEYDEAVATLDKLGNLATGCDAIWLNRRAEWESFIALNDVVSQTANTRTTTIALSLMLKLAADRIDQLDEHWVNNLDEPKWKGWVPIAAVLGVDLIRTEDAAIIRKAIKKMGDRNQLENNEKGSALRTWAENYLEN